MTSFLQPHLEGPIPWLYVESAAWTGVGLLGAFLFGSRFVIQWLSSERCGRLVIPPLFWHLSFWGSVVSLLYAMHLDKLPIILGQAVLPILHGRNLWLLRDRRDNARPRP